MRLAFTLSLFTTMLFAYSNNDTISLKMQQTLQLNPQKVTIVDFFASWCGSCKKEIPHISKVNATLNTQNYEIIGIDVDKNIQDGMAFQNQLKENNMLNFRVINDPENEIVKAFNPIGMPALYYIKNNTVVKVIYGAVDDIDHLILNDLKAMEH